MQLVVAVPGPLDLSTGGYEYDRRIVRGLRAQGWIVELAELPSGFPAPSAADLAATAAWLERLDPAVPVVIDGLAFGAMPDELHVVKRRLRLLALVHHPLADETGLDAATVERLYESEARALQAARGAIVTSPFTARRLEAFGMAPARIRVVPPGVDRLRLAAGGGDVPTLLCVGSYAARKGHDVLLRALDRIGERPWRLVCAGAVGLDPVHEARVRELAARFGDRVILLGPQPWDDLERLYAAADVFVLASHYEGYGMVLSEALAAGLPIVACAGGATRETVPPEAGLLVPPGDVTGLAASLAAVIDDQALRRRLRDGARAARTRLLAWSDAARAFGAAVQDLAR